MKNWTFILLLILFPLNIFGQNDSISAVNEFRFTINRTNIKDSNSENLFGFGLGAYHIFRQQMKMNIIIGLEYNRTNQFKKSMYSGHVAHKTNVTYNINCISIPITSRINFGRNIKIFFETGLFVDINIGGRENGTMHTYFTNENDQLELKEYEYSSKTRLDNNYGLIFGLGIDIPFYKFRIIIEPDYKLGMRNIYNSMYDIRNSYFRINIGLKI